MTTRREKAREASARRIAELANVPDPFSKSFLKQLQLAGEASGTSIEPVMIQTPRNSMPPPRRLGPPIPVYDLYGPGAVSYEAIDN